MKKIILPPRMLDMIISVVVIVVGIIFKCLGVQGGSIPRHDPQSVVYLGIVVFLIKFRFVVITPDTLYFYYFAGIRRKISRDRLVAIEWYEDEDDNYLVISPNHTVAFSLSGRSFEQLTRGRYLKYFLIFIPKSKIYETMEFLEKHFPDYKRVKNRNTIGKHL